MKIVVDLDQTLLDCTSKIYQISNRFLSGRYKKKLNFNVIDPNEKPKKFLRISSMQNADNYFEVENSVEVIKNWFNEGDEIILLSSRPNFSSLNATILDWLGRFEMPYHRLIVHCSNKTLFCQKENVDVLIDNTYNVCKHAAKHNVNVIFYNPYTDRDIEEATTVKSWNEIAECVNNLKQNKSLN